MHDSALTFSLKLISRGLNLASDSKPCFYQERRECYDGKLQVSVEAKCAFLFHNIFD